jgi:hypothetical protein
METEVRESEIGGNVNVIETAEQSKGYWSDNSAGYLDVAVSVEYANDTRDAIQTSTILLSSNYWYRVQHFRLTDGSAWNWLKALLRDCGRKLPELAADVTAFVYRIGNLSLQQVNQMYYLLKHSLTSAKVTFTLAHSLTMINNHTITIPAPKSKKNRRAKRKTNTRPLEDAATDDGGWKIVGVAKCSKF